jgi:hypothetical protein
MNPLPAQDLRSNLATWAVPTRQIPAVAGRMRDLLPPETYDLAFAGQRLETTYFDTAGFALRAARKRGDRYLTLRIRCYQPSDAYAFSAKTEAGKFRTFLDRGYAQNLLSGGFQATDLDFLPPDLLARLLDVAGDRPLRPVVTVCFQRYAVEDADNRLTLDLDVATDTGKQFPSGVLEHKANYPQAGPNTIFPALGLRPIKLSKFLWATRT